MLTEWLGGGFAVLVVDGIGVLDAEASGYDVVAIQLLPHGPAWSRRPTSTTRKLATALARTHARTDYAIGRLALEANPATADEALDEWEAFAGLPGCGEPPTTLADRRLAVVAKLFRSRGPLSRERAEAIAAELGYVTFTWRRTYRPFKCGSKCGAPLAGSGDGTDGGWQWHAAFIVAPANPELDDTLRCIVSNAAPGHFTLTVITEP
jgi:uncharacterized protein YmfQ (DUF2313 family)